MAKSLEAFRAQLGHVTACYEKQRDKARFRTCSAGGLGLASTARFYCTRAIRAQEAARGDWRPGCESLRSAR